MSYVIIIIFLLLSAFFSGMEMAFISANKLKVEIQRKEDSRRAKILARFYDKPQTVLSTLLVGNNIALVIFTYAVSKLFDPVLSPFLGSGLTLLLVVTVLTTIVVLLFGEFLPKTMGRLYANEFVELFVYPLLFFQYLFSIPSKIMMGGSTLLIRLFVKDSIETDDRTFSKVDLENLVNSNVQSDIEYEIDTDLFKNALNLSNIKIKSCMIPRTEIIALDVEASVDELRQMFNESKLSRILIYDQDIENILGYVHHLQLLHHPDKIKPLILDVPFIPETMMVTTALNNFILNNQNIACVVDEFGSVSGLISLEDIVEEIFGDIEDEHDEDDLVMDQKISEYEYIFSGRMKVDDINEKYPILQIPEGEYSTLSGYLVMTLGDIPEEKEVVELAGFTFTLEKVDEKKIEVVRVVKHQL
ncbi:hemolysin family protein [Membranihabitans marinus]|uniref:hemolysin family protein n=1 Tax=Membranihabitans marinus TaxID=1227546 RepID=UPI001F16CAEC|nr:hemolysin family protein [Membranihabitans marinus]